MHLEIETFERYVAYKLPFPEKYKYIFVDCTLEA
ncbi:MAG: hypothetical protein JWP00_3041 [Chloroflexi bacterium]|nr:hypothetical protein [Chloroflexota bacterium]